MIDFGINLLEGDIFYNYLTVKNNHTMLLWRSWEAVMAYIRNEIFFNEEAR